MKLTLLLLALVAAATHAGAAAVAEQAASDQAVSIEAASDQQAVSNEQAASGVLPAYETYSLDGRAVDYKNIGGRGWDAGIINSWAGYERKDVHSNVKGLNDYRHDDHEDKDLKLEKAFLLREYYRRLANGTEGRKNAYDGVNWKKNYFKGIDGEEFLIQRDSYGKGHLEPRFLFYGRIGRHGLGLQKANLFVAGVRFPVTPEIIEPIGYRSYRKDFPYDKLDSVYSP